MGIHEDKPRWPVVAAAAQLGGHRLLLALATKLVRLGTFLTSINPSSMVQQPSKGYDLVVGVNLTIQCCLTR